MKADPAQQAALLDLQGLDTRLDQIAHRRAHLPEQAALDVVTADRAQAEAQLVHARTEVGDVAREVAKAEADVQLVRDRAARNRARLDAGTGPPKELTALQHELESLARRQSDLEDAQLEVMERAEEADVAVAALTARVADLAERCREAGTARDAVVATLDAEERELRGRRAELTPGVSADLLGLYEKIRAQSGVGAAALVERRCEGCRLEILGADYQRVVAAPADEVVRCEECRRILVRPAGGA